jgi:anaerobic ribonucleoside-triphosphate reductase activating protein
MTLLRQNSTEANVTTLGPSPALGIWVQGCDRACPECVSPHTHSPEEGVLREPADVAHWMNESPLSHLTISGGEPMQQAPALIEMIDLAREKRDWIVTCYSWYLLKQLQEDVLPRTADLLQRLDLLIDGPFIAALAGSFLWRGSSNQKIHNLSGRVKLPDHDESQGMTVEILPDGSFAFVGVPPERGMVDRFIEASALRGTEVSVTTR